MFRKLGDTLKAKFSRRDHLSRQLEITKILEMYQAELKKLSLADRTTRPTSFKNGSLIIKMASAAKASELRYHETEIVNKIHAEIGRAVIKKVIYRF